MPAGTDTVKRMIPYDYGFQWTGPGRNVALSDPILAHELFLQSCGLPAEMGDGQMLPIGCQVAQILVHVFHDLGVTLLMVPFVRGNFKRPPRGKPKLFWTSPLKQKEKKIPFAASQLGNYHRRVAVFRLGICDDHCDYHVSAHADA